VDAVEGEEDLLQSRAGKVQILDGWDIGRHSLLDCVFVIIIKAIIGSDRTFVSPLQRNRPGLFPFSIQTIGRLNQRGTIHLDEQHILTQQIGEWDAFVASNGFGFEIRHQTGGGFPGDRSL